MFNKDTFRLIKKTFNRFFSLVMIVLIGVAFMMGLMSTGTMMRKSVDIYDDDYHLQDLQIYSSYGFCDEDVDGLKKVEGVEAVFASKFVDCYCRNESGGVVVARVEEVNRDVNQFMLIEGRLPEKENEVVLLSSSVAQTNYQIGNILEVYLEDSDLSEKLTCSEYTIVGMAKAPAYTSKVLGTSTLDNCDLNIVLYVPNSNFIFDYYTTIYLTLDGASDFLSYTNSYSDYISEHMGEVEYYAKNQQDYLKDEIIAKYTEEIQEGEQKLAEEKEKGQKELDDAKDQLEEARIKLIYAETAIDTNETQLKTSEEQLKVSEKLIEENEKEINKALTQIEEQTGQDFDTIYAEVSTAYYTYITIKNSQDTPPIYSYGGVQEQIESYQKQIKENNEKIADIQNNQLPAVQSKIDATQAKIDGLDATSESYESDLTTLTTELNGYKREKIELESQIELLKTRNTALENIIQALSEETSEDVRDSINDVADQMDQTFIDYGFEGVEDAYNQLTTLKNGMEQLEQGKQQIIDGKAQIETGKQQIAQARATVAANKVKYNNGVAEYTEGLLTFNDEIEKAEAEIRKAYQQLEELPAAQWRVLDRDYQYSALMYESTCKQMEAIGYSLPFLFYLVAALVCMTTMTRLVDEQRGQIGVFRALGFSKVQIVSKYVIYALAASLLGSFVGVFVGMAIFPTVIYETWRLMYVLPDRVVVFPISTLLISVLAFSLLMMIVTTLVVNKSLNEMPSQLLRPKAPKNAKAVFLEKIKFIWNRLSFTGKITARNIIRYKTRFFMTVIGVAGCTGLLVIGFGVKDSISEIIEIQYKEIFHYDYNVNLDSDHNIEEIISTIESDLDNEHVVPYMTYTTNGYFSDGSEATANAMIIDARECSDVFTFRFNSDKKTETKLNNTGVLVSAKYAKNNNIKAGDTITIESSNGVKAEVKVNAIIEMYFQHYIFISEDLYQSLFDESVNYTTIAVSTLDGEKLRGEIDELENINSITDFSSMINQFEIMINALDFIILVIILTAGSLAFVVLMNLTQVNVSERMREIATLKVLGFNEHEVNMYLFKEIFLLSAIGGLVGLPLGVLEHHFIMNVISMDMVMFGMNISIQSFSYSFAITIIFTIIVLLFTRKQLRQIEMIESLKSVE